MRLPCAITRLKAKLQAEKEAEGGQVRVMDPELIHLGTMVAVGTLERGQKDFASFATALLDSVGPEARIYLRSWYEAARYYPGFDATGMSSAVEIQAWFDGQRQPPRDGALANVARAMDRTDPRPQVDAFLALIRAGRMPKDNTALNQRLAELLGTKRAELTDARIKNAPEARTRRALLAQLRVQYESGRVKGVYFPLARFGEYYLHVERADGEREFSLFETPRQQREAVEQLLAQGVKRSEIRAGKKIDNLITELGPGQTFMADVLGKVDRTMGDGIQTQQLKHDLWQMYLQTLPEVSIRKHLIHRKGTLGYSGDALRAFAHQMGHGARQIARLNAGHALTDRLEAMKNHAEALSRTDLRKSNQASDITGALSDSYEWMMNPNSARWASIATSTGFAWYLGATPAAALVNMTQVPIIALPVLGARYGFGRSAAQLSQAMHEYLGSRFSKGARARLERQLNGDMGRMLKELEASGVIDRTLTMSLIGLEDSPASQFNLGFQKVMQGIGWTYHQAERFNREVTAIAAYRLARDDGRSHEAAVDNAYSAVFESQFDYSSGNRAKFMQGNAARVFLLFRQFSQNVTYLLARNTLLALKGESKEVRVEAMKKLTGILAGTAVTAGVVGLPLLNTILWAIQAGYDLGKEEDDPEWDARLALRQYLAELPGGRVITTGVVNEFLGIDLSTRTSLNQLWMRSADPNLDSKGLTGYWLEQAAGPVFGIGINAARGIDLIRDGHAMRGVEAMTPKLIRDSLRATRFHLEDGAHNLRGDPILEDLTPGELVIQASGFAPARLVERYEQNRLVRGLERSILDRRRGLMNSYYMAWQQGDREGLRKTMSAMRAFNQAYPEVPVTARGIRQSFLNRAHYRQEAVDGYAPNRRLREYLMEQRYADGPPRG